ncbi:MAG: methionyl-tRNA formyltransferase [Candidatus Ryanbacteria bacterium]|nr:methionyl-tRNA formyltransferase [Candidatus Ryanbacteria bacterium]
MSAPRIVFFGTPEFVIPVLEALQQKYRPTLIVSTPEDSKKGPSPVTRWAMKNNIAQIAPAKLSHALFGNKTFDLFIIAAYGKILKKEILAIPKKGTLNIHPSLLPKYRGPSPIQETILQQETETGVTIIVADELADHGPIVEQKKIQIEPKENGASLSHKLWSLAANIINETVENYLSGSIKPREQDHVKATFTKMLKREDALISWQEKADHIERKVRAYLLWPTCWTFFRNLRIKILDVEIGPEKKELESGTRTRLQNEMAVAAKDKLIILKKVQPEGK